MNSPVTQIRSTMPWFLFLPSAMFLPPPGLRFLAPGLAKSSFIVYNTVDMMEMLRKENFYNTRWNVRMKNTCSFTGRCGKGS
jgi:hypothetical protein